MRPRIEARWRSGYAPDCKSVYAGSIPARASTNFTQKSQALAAEIRVVLSCVVLLRTLRADDQPVRCLYAAISKRWQVPRWQVPRWQVEVFSVRIGTDSQDETNRYGNAIVDNGGQEIAYCAVRGSEPPRGKCFDPLNDGMADPALVAGQRAFKAMMTIRKIAIAAGAGG